MDRSLLFNRQTLLSTLHAFFSEHLSELILRGALPQRPGPDDTFLSSTRIAVPLQTPNPFLEGDKPFLSIEELRLKIRELVSVLLEKIASKESPRRLTENVLREEVEDAARQAGYQETIAENVASFVICDGLSEQIEHYNGIRRFLEKERHLPTLRDVRFIGGSVGDRRSILFKKESPFGGVMQIVDRVAATSANVLLLGETGVGKELLAKEIHRRSPRRDGPFVVLNLSALPEDLVESEMFGHERGAFTGAFSRRTGKFELANGGTLFLDEIGEISLQTQVKLLRFLQERTFERVGSNQTLSTDVRLISATNKDLETMIREGTFRTDLYYRVCVFPIRIPSLRERFVDIPPLAHHFMRFYARQYNRSAMRLSPEALRILMNHSFPGNIRELENIIVRGVLLAEGDTIQREHLILSSSDSSTEVIPATVSSYFQHRIDEILNELESTAPATLSPRDRRRVIPYLKEKKAELIRFLSLSKTGKIRNADYRRCFSCSSITARRHLKLLTQCGILLENQAGHRGRGAHYTIAAPPASVSPTPHS